jgi:hypothetical protein
VQEKSRPESATRKPGDGSPPEEPGSHLLEESILPTWLNQRAVSFWGFNYIWIGLAVVIVTFQYGANSVAAGYTIPAVLATAALARAIAWIPAATLSLIWMDIAFPIAFVLYYAPMKLWVLPKYRQAEIESSYDDRYLATSTGLNRVYHRESGFSRDERTEILPPDTVRQEDL